MAWISAVERRVRTDGPSALMFSRQNLPFQKRDATRRSPTSRSGGYVLPTATATPQALITRHRLGSASWP